MSLLIDLQKRRQPASIGNKAWNLSRLYRLGITIPYTLTCDEKAYRRYVENDVSLVEELRAELQRKLRPDRRYAVRSSANIEDGLDHSFAGQFKSVLNVQGVDAILQAIWSVWSSAQTPAVMAYFARHNIPAGQLAMAVIIQEMVPAEWSGVVLSRNPVTGANETVVEAVRGLGDSLVQSGVTPMRWINKWGSWLTKPEGDSLPLIVVTEIVEKTREVTRRFKSPVDMEWAYDGQKLYFLQVRDITTLNCHTVYSNHISKEMLPGMIKPLIASVNLPLVCSMWVRLMNEMIGQTRVKPEELARTFYYRVYFNMGVLSRIFEDVGMPAESIELMINALPEGAAKPALKPTMKTLLRLPTMLKFAVEKWNFAGPLSRALPRLQEELDTFDYRSADRLSAQELVSETERLYLVLQDVVYYNKVGQILMGMFNLGLKRQLAKAGVDFKDFDLMEGQIQIREYDPKTYLSDLHLQFMCLDPQQKERIRKATYTEFLQMEGLEDLQSKLSGFFERFGHLSDNGNDFSSTPWRESPGMVMQLILDFAVEQKEEGRRIRFSQVKTNVVMRSLYRRAREFRLLREQISSLYTFGYGLFRYYYLAMGHILVDRGWMDSADDIFYLTSSEAKQAVLSSRPLADYRSLAQQHKAEMEHCKEIPLPAIIYGEVAPPVQDPSLKKLVGIPTSIGYYTGRVAAVRGIQDFSKVKQGDVLVIPYSDVSWTPLFARAGAVISESGGLLSHSSIVAREYNIPAVVSADGAMRLRDQTLVTVNGHTGEVIIHPSN